MGSNNEDNIDNEAIEDSANSVAEDTSEAAEDNELGYTDISPAEAKDMIDNNPDLIVIDVSPHYDDGHIPGALHYYLADGSLDEAIPSLDPQGEYLVYCHVDSVAIAGAQKLADAGFEKVYRLEGNYGAWVDAGYPVEK
jgi:adenylyltransferase/sulfurtransferase